MTGRPGYRTMEMIGGSSVPRRTSPAPLASPRFVHCLIGVEAEGLLDYQGWAGIISIVRWNLRPVIFGVERRDVATSHEIIDIPQRRKRNPNPNFLVRIFGGGGGGGGLPREGAGPQSSVCPSKPRETKLFGGISQDFAGISRRRQKSLSKKRFVFDSRPPKPFFSSRSESLISLSSYARTRWCPALSTCGSSRERFR